MSRDIDGKRRLHAVLGHQTQIENLFLALQDASQANARRRTQHRLATLMNGHFAAVERVIYPELTCVSSAIDAVLGRTQQSISRVHLAGLHELDPMSRRYLGRLAHLEAVFGRHVRAERRRLLDLQVRLHVEAVAALDRRYQEAFEHHVCTPCTWLF